MAIMLILGGRAVLLQVLAIAVGYRADLCILLYLVPIKISHRSSRITLMFSSKFAEVLHRGPCCSRYGSR